MNKSYKISKVIAWILFLGGTAWANASDETLSFEIPQGNLSIERAFQMALENNPSIDEVEERVAGAEATIKRAKSYLFPVIDVSAGYNHRHATAHPDWATEMRGSADFNDITAGLNMRWRLFDGLQDIHYIRAARKSLESARYIHLDAQRILLEQVSAAFIQSEMAKEQMRISKSDYEFNRKLESDAKVRFEVGELPEADVLNFSLALVVAESNFLNAKRDFDSACSIIALLLGLESAELPVHDYPLISTDDYSKEIGKYGGLFALAMANRPDVQASLAAIAVYEHQVDAIKGSFLPKVELVSGINYTKTNDMGTINQDENSSYAGLQANWNVFSGGRRKAQVAEMMTEKNVQLHRYHQLTDAVASEIRQDLVNLRTSDEIMRRQVKAEEYSRKIRDFVEQAYQGGEVSVTRLNEAQTNWNRAASSLAVSKLQVLLNQFALESTTGEILSRVN